MRATLGIDIGTFETKGVLAGLEGQVLATASRPHAMLVPQPGWAEHRPKEDWWDDVRAVARALLATSGLDPRAIGAMGVSAIGPCMLPVDQAGEPLMNAVLYGVDTRAAREIAELTERIGGDVLMTRCGNALTSQSVGPKILWFKRNRPALFARTRRILTSTSYVVQRLTGRAVIDHYSAAGFTPFYSFETFDWDLGLADDVITREQLPDLLWTGEIAGRVTARAAAETGLAEGTPVIAGTIDAAAEAVSAGVVVPGDMMVMYGSTMFTILLTESRVREPRLWSGPWLRPGPHALMAGLATSGTLTTWFRDQFARELPAETAHGLLAEEAARSPPGARGLVVLPHWSGERTPLHDPDAKGLVFGLDLTHTRADLARAMVEGIAYGTGQILETYGSAGHAPARLSAVGGGTRNGVWLQAVSDVAQRRQAVPGVTIGAALGDAFLAAVAIGTARPDDIARWNPPARTIAPNPAHAALYARQFALYKQLYARTAPMMKALTPA